MFGKDGISRRGFIRSISFLFALLIVLIVAALGLYNERNAYKTQIQYSYQLALDELAASLETIHVALQKGLYSTTPLTLSGVSSTLTKAAGTAKAALADLPLSGGELATINKFLSQVGDYTTSLSRGAIAGQALRAEDSENLRLLANTADTLYRAVADMLNGSARPGDSAIPAAENELSALDAAMLETEDSITDYPTLIYDGPFSDHLLQATPKLLENQQQLTREGARQVAALYLGVSAEQIRDDGDEESAMACYGFQTDDATIAITKKGGFCAYFRRDRTVGTEHKNYDQAKEIAKAYLKQLGLGEFRDSYFITDEGLCVINFAAVQENVICYPDLVKVGVALDTGEVLLFEGRGYIMNHTRREIHSPEKSVEEARAVLSDALTVDSWNLAVIPTDGGQEKFCYEFVCTGTQDEHVLVYIHADTLAEEQLLILLTVDGGVLTK